MRTRWALAATGILMAVTGCSPGAQPTVVPSVATSIAPGGTAPPTSTAASATTTVAGSPQNTGPKIEYFRIKTKPSCPSGGPATTFPGNPIVLEWKISRAAQVTISIDGPGVFGTYDATGQQEFPFTCNGPSGSTQKHTYLLRIAGTGISHELTGEARIN